jgi:hypothetical protein
LGELVEPMVIIAVAWAARSAPGVFGGRRPAARWDIRPGMLRKTTERSGVPLSAKPLISLNCSSPPLGTTLSMRYGIPLFHIRASANE